MIEASKIGKDFKQKLKMRFSPVGLFFADKKPENALGFKSSGNGCIMPLILASAKGKTIAFDENSLGWNCSAFHLGYKDWIFEGIEFFLSHRSLIDQDCERFVKTPESAKRYIEALKPREKTKGAAIFKPLEKFSQQEKPEIVIFFGNPDQLSALVYLLYFDAPIEENFIVARFASACGSIITLPLQYSRNDVKKAVWGIHDISARKRLPKELMSLTFPYDLLVEMWKGMKESFLYTEKWDIIAQRI